MIDEPELFTLTVGDSEIEILEEFQKHVIENPEKYPLFEISEEYFIKEIKPEIKRFIEYQEARRQATEIICMFNSGKKHWDDFYNLPPIHGLTLLCVLSNTDGALSEKAKEMLKQRQSEIAKKKRRGHKDKPTVKEWWEKWKTGKISYVDDTDFVNAMMDKTDMKRGNTIRQWMAEWKKYIHT